jgi:hypothetical protein
LPNWIARAAGFIPTEFSVLKAEAVAAGMEGVAGTSELCREDVEASVTRGGVR